jgi:hypothetical protein
MPPCEDISWHLDKKVPIGLMLALLVQTIKDANRNRYDVNGKLVN